MALSLPDIIQLLSKRGAAMYGREPVTQLEHALQCAQLAEDSGARPALVAAGLLHDLGHLLVERTDGSFGPDVDDIHQYIAIPFLRHVFPDAVIEPICLHVDAKRYLCHAEPHYWNALSAAAKRSLEMQGGAYNEGDAQRFLNKPFARDAIRLRRWDDLAKSPGKDTRGLAHYEALLRECALAHSTQHRTGAILEFTRTQPPA